MFIIIFICTNFQQFLVNIKDILIKNYDIHNKNIQAAFFVVVVILISNISSLLFVLISHLNSLFVVVVFAS